MPKSKFIKMNSVSDVMNFVKEASKIEGDVTVLKGRYIIDGKSIMGVMSIDMSTGMTVEYPTDAVDFENFISQFES